MCQQDIKSMTHKIVHLVYSFGCGGLEKVIANLINFSENYSVEHIIVSLTDETAMMEQLNHPVKLVVLDKQPGNDLSSHLKLYQLLTQLKPHTIQTYNFGTIEYHLTAAFARVPVRVHSDHGRGGDDPHGKNRLHNYFRKWVAHFIHHYVVVSDDLYRWVTEQLKIPKAKVTLMFNGVAIPELKPTKHHELTQFVTVGRLDKVKNQQLLIDAFALARSQLGLTSAELVIVGDGPLYDALAEQIEALNMSASITLLGYRTDIIEILMNADVFVLSSVYEAMPMTILEAISVKTPVICTNVGGVAQFVNEQQVQLVESNNALALAQAMVQTVNEPAATQQRVEAAHQLLVEQYSVTQMVQQYLTLYHVL